jgi:hypothetical protein
MGAMRSDGERLRYEPDQIAEAVGRARGEGRYFLVTALTELPIERREPALAQVVDMELKPDERLFVLTELARLRPSIYLTQFIQHGLRSRSINVQQVAIANLPTMVGDGLPIDLAQQVERWLRHRMANPRRQNTWATWEVPGVALALLPSYGVDRVVALVASVEDRMQHEELSRWRPLKAIAGDALAFAKGLEDWRTENSFGPLDPDPRDPTANVNVDRAMRRLGYRPANPDSKVYDVLEDFDPVPTFVIDLTK